MSSWPGSRMPALPSGGTGCGTGGPGSTWWVSRAVRLLCHAVPPHSKETPGAIPGTRWHRPAQGSSEGTPGSWGGRRWEAASGRGDSSGWVVGASSPCLGHSLARGCLWSLGTPTLTGSRGPEAGVVSGCRSLVGWPGGTRGMRTLQSGGWLSQELRVFLQDGPAGMSPLGSGDSRGCLGSSK